MNEANRASLVLYVFPLRIVHVSGRKDLIMNPRNGCRHLSVLIVMVVLLAGPGQNAKGQKSPPPRPDLTLAQINSQSTGPFDLGAWVSAVGPSGGVYVAGKMRLGTRIVTRVARWAGGNWTVLGDHLEHRTQDTEADAIAVDNAGNVYLSGNFTHAYNSSGSSVLVNRVARWNAQSQQWEAMGRGVDVSLITRLAVLGDDVYVGGIALGYNPDGNAVQVTGMGRWNATTNLWSPVGQGFSDTIVTVMSMISTGSGIYVGGHFANAVNPGGAKVPVNHIAFWDGTEWQPLGQGLSYSIASAYAWTLALNGGGDVIVSGLFEQARNSDGSSVDGPVVRWDGSRWHNESQGLPLTLGAATFDVDQVVVDGSDALCVYYYDTPLLGDVIARRDAQGEWAKIWHDSDYILKTIAGRPGRVQEGLYAGGLFDQVYDLSRGQTYNIMNNAQWFPATGWSPIAGGIVFGNSVQFARNVLNIPITDLQITSDTIIVNITDTPFAVSKASGNVTDVGVTIDSVMHSNDSDLEFTLIHLGVEDTLVYQVGGVGQNFIGTTLVDSAAESISTGSAPFTGQFRPHKPLSQFSGLSPDGLWILRVYDRSTGNSGTLNAWSLTLKLGVSTVIGGTDGKLPSRYELSQNYPNPFNPTTSIQFSIANPQFTILKVYDVLGHEVATLVNEEMQPGNYEVAWDARGMSSGVYFYRLRASNFADTKKLLLLR